MMGADKKSPIGLSCRLKKDFPYIPVFLLLNNNQDVAIFHEDRKREKHIDKIFVWNGESKVFFAMIKTRCQFRGLHKKNPLDPVLATCNKSRNHSWRPMEYSQAPGLGFDKYLSI